MDDELLHKIFGVDKSYHAGKTELEDGTLMVELEPDRTLFRCPKCQSLEVIGKGNRCRKIQTLPIGFHRVYLRVQIPRCQCKACGQIFEITPPFARRTRTTPTR